MEYSKTFRDTAGMQLAVGPWRLGRVLGEGASGRVCLGKHQKTGRFAAIKIINKDKAQCTTTSIQQAGCSIQHAIEREIAVMNIPVHPNAIQLYEIWDSRDEIYLVLEYVNGGDLLQYMTRKRFLPEREVVRLFKQLITGLSHLHQFSIYHRDLKHENLMMDRSGNIKIGDFGMAALQPEGHKFTSACGSPNYAAPEVVQGWPYNGSAADIWSSGVILYGMLTHQLPFDDPDTSTILNRIVYAEYKMPKSISPEAADLIKRMLDPDPGRRIKLKSVFEHPFMTKYQDRIPSLPLTEHAQIGDIQNFTSHMATVRPLHVDMDIITKLKALWMTQDEGILANKVLFQEGSQERLFYNLFLERHVGGNPIDLSNKSILKPNIPTVFPKLGHNTITTAGGVETEYQKEPISVESAPNHLVFKYDPGRQSLGSDVVGSEKLLEETRISGSRPKTPCTQRPLLEVLESNAEETSSKAIHKEDGDLARSHDQSIRQRKPALEKKFGKLGIIKACIKLFPYQNKYQRKVRNIQSRRSVIFTGSQLAVGNGGSRWLLGFEKQQQKAVTAKIAPKQSSRMPIVESEMARAGNLFQRSKVNKGGPRSQGEAGNRSQGGRAQLVLIKNSHGRQTILFHEPVTKSRRRLNSLFSVWQSYGAGHVRMAGNNIVWSDATVQKPGSGRSFACTLQLAELDGGTAVTVSRSSGPAARLDGIIAELAEYVSAYDTRMKGGEAKVD
ncbi:hypothetical protein TWF730_009525 [Orbilia blumenaviensis]|uniref:Protein kinase domain-containing protein n=1 Tax=Orbilia blumenaviensis TaxID=1796055 RepID=A0AAV9UTF4_9PEZI